VEHCEALHVGAPVGDLTDAVKDHINGLLLDSAVVGHSCSRGPPCC
jgi:hypothetical protein